MANSDTLMDVIQRPQVFKALDELIDQHMSRNKEFGLLLIGPDNFRELNIEYGFTAGDRFLNSLFSCIKRVARDHDYIIRISGSKFLLIVPNIHNEGHATLAAMKLLNELENLAARSDDPYRINVYVGIANYPSHAQDSHNLLRNAEVALLNAKQSSERYYLFSGSDDPADMTQWDIHSDLHLAIERDQFELYFQPQVDLASGIVSGAEALLRWCHPQRSYVGPDYFIPLAEQSRFIDTITEWTIRNALWLSQQWPEASPAPRVAVNLSPKVLSDAGLIESLLNMAQIFDADLHLLTLEITESALMEDVSATIKILERLRSEGINISIDDFGSGYSSLAYFKNIPANELKIDKSFITNMLENPANLHIVSSIINMAQGFELKVVAEGVEDRETYEKLQSMGCDYAQGYYIAKPAPNEKYIEWFREYSEVCDQLVVR